MQEERPLKMLTDKHIPIKEWAYNNKLNPSTVRQKCIRGGYETAIKVGNNWLISKDEENTDKRKKAIEKSFEKL